MLDCQPDIPKLARQQIANQDERLLTCRILVHGTNQAWEAHGLCNNEAVQCDRLGRERRPKNDSSEAAQDLIELYALQKWYLWGRTDLLDDAMDDGGEQGCLVIEAVIERSLGYAGA